MASNTVTGPDRTAGGDTLTRYRWAAQFATGRRVLDAGCGAGSGSALIAAAGAREVIGIDRAAAVIEASAADMPPGVELQVADLRALEHAADSFELVVCFDVLEPGEEQAAIIDGLVRVLAPGGLLVISSVGRLLLSERFEHVALVEQKTFLGSAILPEDVPGVAAALDAARVKWLPEADVEAAAHTISVASDAPLPELAPALGVATMVEYQDWQQTLNTAAERNRALERRVVQLEEQVRDRVALQERLLDAEQRLAEVPGLEQRIERLELAADELVDASEQGLRALHEGHQRELAAKDAEVAAARVEPDALRGEVAALRERLARADRTLAEVFASPSWRITKPLRRLKARLQG